MELDHADVEILRLLQQDGRLSFRDLAKKVGVSVPTISARVSTLQELGILRGYRADIDPERLQEASLLFLVKCAPPRVGEVAAALKELPEIRRVMTARGPRVLALAVVPRGEGIDALLDRIAQVPGIADYEHFVIASVVKDEPLAVISEGLSTTLICFQCKGHIHGEPIKVRIDGRDHYLCCRQCEKAYVERYKKIKAKA